MEGRTHLRRRNRCHEHGNDVFTAAANKPDISSEAMDIVHSLRHPKSDQRMGAGINGVEDIKSHMWLLKTKWKDLAQGRVPAPHAHLCSSKIQTNNQKDLEVEFVEGSPEVAHEDCPEQLISF